LSRLLFFLSSPPFIKLRRNIKKITNLSIILPKIVLVAARPIIAHVAAVSQKAAGTANNGGYKKITIIP
jgi:hypothetical protein